MRMASRWRRLIRFFQLFNSSWDFMLQLVPFLSLSCHWYCYCHNYKPENKYYAVVVKQWSVMALMPLHYYRMTFWRTAILLFSHALVHWSTFIITTYSRDIQLISPSVTDTLSQYVQVINCKFSIISSVNSIILGTYITTSALSPWRQDHFMGSMEGIGICWVQQCHSQRRRMNERTSKHIKCITSKRLSELRMAWHDLASLAGRQ